MKRVIYLLVGLIMLSSCGGSKDTGELMGVEDRKDWYEPYPFGMVLIPMGSFIMGPNDQDVPFAMTAHTKTVSVDPFWMDVTEITNNEYRQFVYWVRDSLARRYLVKADIEGYKAEIDEDRVIDGYDHENANTCFLNWEKEIEWKSEEEEYVDALKNLFLPVHERFYRRKEIDTRKLIYEYYWVDLKQAAKKSNRYNFNDDYTSGEYKGMIIDSKGENKKIKDRSAFIMNAKIDVYPDTLVWMADYTYSYNDPYAQSYFWHPAFDNYPVVGVTWKQANAFAIWRTQLMRNYMAKKGEPAYQDYRLPTEAEWEYAARGGMMLTMYPWGGPYTRNNTGCFIANFKPLRGNYGDDGANETVEVAKYSPNEYGLFDMSGNVAEWTSNAFDESAYSFTHDLNPDYTYNALAKDEPVLKRKVIRGGSWKDIGYYLQLGTRTYEYQDTAKSYIGFRCVRSYLGRAEMDWDASMF